MSSAHILSRPGGLSTLRGRIGRRCCAGWVVALIGGLVCGCTSVTPAQPGTESSVPPVSTSAGPATQSPATPSPTTGSGPTTATVTTTPSPSLPPGSAVPFRTVEPNSASGIRIGLIASSGSDPFSTAVAESVLTQAESAGADVIRCDPGANPSLELDCAQRLATQRVDGWIAVQPIGTGEALCAAGPRGAPLIGINTPALSCQTARVGADDEQAGYVAGAALGQYVRTRLNCHHDAVMIVADGAAGDVAGERIDGIRAGLAAYCPAAPPAGEVTIDASGQGGAFEAFTAAFTALPADADVVVAATDDGAAFGAAAAIPAARTGHVTLAGIGADQRARCAIATDPRWIGDAALFPDRYGEVAVPALLDAVAGRPVPPNMYVETTFLDAYTLGDHYDLSECPD